MQAIQTRVEKFEIGIDIDSSVSDWFRDILAASVEPHVTNSNPTA